MRKRTVSFEPANNMPHFSAIVSCSLVQKKEDPRAFMIPYTIKSSTSQSLCVIWVIALI